MEKEAGGGGPWGRVAIDGKQFARDGRRFHFRGVTYGTFAPRLDGALFPKRDQVKRDFSAMAERGFTVVRTYTEPTEDVLELASEFGLQLLAGVFFPDWRYLIGTARRELRAIEKQARATVAAAARRLAGHDAVLGLCVGNEIPADVLRWLGTERIAKVVNSLVDVVHEADTEQLVTYGNYPTTEYLQLPSLDFVTFNVFLERETDFRRYLNRLHHLAGDRPLVLGEVGLDSGGMPEGERAQAEVLDWQLATAIEQGVAGTCVFSWTDEWAVGGERVEGWHFGLTREDRSPRPALDVAQRWNGRTVADVKQDWPRISAVICAYNAEAYIDECLRHTCALDYPDLEVVVVDDGSTDRTAEIARRHRRARVVESPHGGLSVARNEGFRAATGDLIAYLDSDAFPTPEWPYYLALGLFSKVVAGVGGPNVPPADDPPGAHVVARAPGGPVHVLIGDDRAEHVPGCNMAFWRYALEEVGGFDPIYTAAGDDVDICWKILDRDWEIGFHPAALVWHRRRPTVRTYLKQQRSYGRAEALVEARHPDRYTALGTARWRGRIYSSFVPSPARQRVYRGTFGVAAYQSVYRGGGHAIDVAHQLGVPVAIALIATTPLALLLPGLGWIAGLALCLLGGLAAVDYARARPPQSWAGGRRAFRAHVALLHMLQPLVRLWARSRRPRLDLPEPQDQELVAQATPAGLISTLMPAIAPRPDQAAGLVRQLRRAGLRVSLGSGWEDYDARILGSILVVGDLVTSGYPEGCLQARVRPHVHGWRVALLALGVLPPALLTPRVTAVVISLIALEVLRGTWRSLLLPRRIIRGVDTVAGTRS